jgi:hypothetical protein
MKQSLFFIVFKHNDELATQRCFATKDKAKDHFDDVGFNKKLVCIKEAVYKVKDKRK